MNIPATRDRRLPAVALGIILIGALTGCDSHQVIRQGDETWQRSTGLRCQFTLEPVVRKPSPSKPGPVPMKELLRDTSSAFTYVNRFYKAHWGECFNFAYHEPLRKPNIQTGDQIPCGKGVLESDNAAYCNDGRWVGIGVDVIRLGKDRGDMVAYVAVAHELGHGVQSQLLGTKYSHLIQKPGTKDFELQADCLAGAALGGSAQEKGGFTWQDHDAQEVNEAYAAFGDLESVNNPTHGDATQRAYHFEQGREGGVAACFKKPWAA